MNFFRSILFFGLLPTPSALCAAADNPIVSRIEMSVTMDDPGLRDRIVSTLSKHFRDLTNVAVVDSDGSYTLEIAGFTLENKANQKTGFGLTSSFIAPLDARYLFSFLSSHSSEATQSKSMDNWATTFVQLLRVPKTSWVLLYSNTYTGALGDDLENTCRDIVAGFDANVLVMKLLPEFASQEESLV